MNDRVTWLLPVRNGMPYLPETLASIEAQTYHNWEILAWDDGSTDGTLEELKKWIPSRLPGKIFTGESLGVGGALALLVEMCGTDLCARIDADDVNLPERLETQINYLKGNPEIAILGSAMYQINSQGVRSKYLYQPPVEHDDIVHSMLTMNPIAHPSVLFKRSVILEVGNYKSLLSVEDYDMWMRVAATHHYKLANLACPLIEYRIHPASENQATFRRDPKLEIVKRCFYRTAESLFGCSMSEAEQLRNQQHPCAIKAFYKIALFLQKNQGGSVIHRLCSQSFIQACKGLISPRDYTSHLIVFCIEWRPSVLLQKILSTPKLIQKIIRKLGSSKTIYVQ